MAFQSSAEMPPTAPPDLGLRNGGLADDNQRVDPVSSSSRALTIGLQEQRRNLVMEPKPLRRNILQRLFGICATKPPSDNGCWTFHDSEISVDLARVPELAKPNRAVRLEKRGVPGRFLLVHGNDGRYYAFKNRCTHAGRRLDPIPGTQRVQCCSIGRSTYDGSGKVLSGPAKDPLEVLPVRIENNRLMIKM
jgi:nitrite reductase/ring-hydroxylating ferredoxin subunit